MPNSEAWRTAFWVSQIGSEIGAGQRRAHIAQDLAAVRLDDIAGVAFQRMAESIVRRDEEPAVAAGAGHGAARAVGQDVGVVDIVHAIARGRRVGEVGRG
ncbi:hypothetical protein G6F32_016810 [Rhizopus arrhizus]|nr:hypothetical protein G6F32_016810 [Rhizopus arrhizus]